MYRCWSSVGRRGGSQYLSVGCGNNGSIIHELLHALGLWHEHSRLDREAYVRIDMNNVYYPARQNFEKHPRGKQDSLGVPYDLNSIMHYSEYVS